MSGTYRVMMLLEETLLFERVYLFSKNLDEDEHAGLCATFGDILQLPGPFPFPETINGLHIIDERDREEFSVLSMDPEQFYHKVPDRNLLLQGKSERVERERPRHKLDGFGSTLERRLCLEGWSAYREYGTLAMAPDDTRVPELWLLYAVGLNY